jgi:uncharacterized damage-inducible protein DinB
MTSPRQLLLAQLAACTDTNGWFVSLQSAVAGLGPARAAWRPDASSHSIWQIVTHVTFWNEIYLRRWRGETPPSVGNNDTTFEIPAPAGVEPDWKAAVTRFEQVMGDWKKELESATDERLEAPVRKESPGTWGATLSHMALHTAHHVGQIVTLRKLQGSWDPKQGVS